MRVYFARHGETDWNAHRWVQGSTDTLLNAAGIAQAEKLGETLKARGAQIKCVYTSELRRAQTTGKIVARKLGVPCESRPGLQEIGLGDWEGRTWRQIEHEWPELHKDWETRKRSTRPPNGETYVELLERFVGAVLKIVREAQGDVMIVSHSACLLAFQAELNRTPLERMLKDYTAPNAGVIEIDAQRILDRWA